MYTTYTGEKVRIRPFASEAEFSGYVRNYAVSPNEHLGIQWDVAARSASEWQRLSISMDSFAFAIERTDNGEFVGLEYCGIGRWQLSAFPATGIVPAQMSQGFGREAKLLAFCFLFENFPVESLWSDTTAVHSRSRAGLEAVGFRQVGRTRLSHFVRGHFVDTVYFQLLRSEWEAMDYRHRVQRS
ncbi:MAG: GNAT family N-acetyltransferase [Planctomycetales bacterium]|nr:GNAT family N-acetyltransferase [bacterium]UNM09629.1 MAG: GNAT family N-acetyltransferase [Planctomycetales bacterium]